MKIVEIFSDDDVVLDEGDPSLVAAVKHVPTGKIYPGKPGQAHWDVASENGFAGERWKEQSTIQTGFLNSKGHFLDRRRALAYAVKHGLISDYAARYLDTNLDAPLELGASYLRRPSQQQV